MVYVLDVYSGIVFTAHPNTKKTPWHIDYVSIDYRLHIN